MLKKVTCSSSQVLGLFILTIGCFDSSLLLRQNKNGCHCALVDVLGRGELGLSWAAQTRCGLSVGVWFWFLTVLLLLATVSNTCGRRAFSTLELLEYSSKEGEQGRPHLGTQVNSVPRKCRPVGGPRMLRRQTPRILTLVIRRLRM